MKAPVSRFGLAVIALAAVLGMTGCANGSSGDRGAASPTPTASEAAATRLAVDAAFSITDSAIRTFVKVKHPYLVDSQYEALAQGSDEMLSAAFGLVPAPIGVPASVAGAAYHRLVTMAHVLQRSATCLAKRYRPKRANYRPCFAAFQTNGAGLTDLVLLVKAMIALEPYGSPSAAAQFRELFESFVPQATTSA
ncbi:MAG TPA: hypothetical protein VME70_03915 [Mycobacteriales bacterium]|nr:hypothetical protein [Mycobacteriales bacterium]